jgi:hypothetical protein
MPGTNGRTRVAAPPSERGSDLFTPRDACDYNPQEREFSRFVEGQLEKLLKGETNCLYLLRRYHQRPDLLGAPLPKSGVDPQALRLTVIEEALTRVLVFLQTGMPGGPISQESHDGRLVERQLHTTRFPHIVIERVDTYEAASNAPLETEWVVKRMQNQKVDTRISRVLDVANIGLEFFRAAR